MRARNLVLCVGSLLLAACPAPPLPPGADAGSDAGPPAPSTGGLIDTGRVFMDECLSYNSPCEGSTDPTCGRCEYRIVYDSSKCSTTRPCDNLLLFFAAGGCDKGPMEEAVRNNTDFVSACVQPVAPGELLPVSVGAPQRDNVVIARVLDALRAQGWTGKKLLIGGCSAGASRYPVVAARYADAAAWVGSATTGVCMSEGVVSISYQDNFMGERSSVQSCKRRHGRMVTGYTNSSAAPPSAHSCSTSSDCACNPLHTQRTFAGDCASSGGDCVGFDSIVQETATGFAWSAGVNASAFAVTNWKLISEGSAFENTDARCDKDVAPEAPYKALCQLIDADAAHRCTHVTYPDLPHCSAYSTNFSSLCIDWFRTL